MSQPGLKTAHEQSPGQLLALICFDGWVEVTTKVIAIPCWKLWGQLKKNFKEKKKNQQQTNLKEMIHFTWSGFHSFQSCSDAEAFAAIVDNSINCNHNPLVAHKQ